MNSEKLRNLFEENIKKYLKRAKLRQTYLATLLDVSPSAVSQMIKCRLLMNRKQLHVVSKGLKLTQDEELELLILLSKIRNGVSDFRTPFNRLMKSYRRERKLTIQKLYKLTHISPLRLKAFEDDFNVDFSYDDAVKMAEVYNCEPAFLLKKLDFTSGSSEYGNETNHDTKIIEVADSGAAKYSAPEKLPIVPLREFREFTGNADLFVFGNLRSHEEIVYHIEKKAIGINASDKDLNMPCNGNVILFVTDQKPLIYVCRLFLCMDSSKKFHLLQKNEDSEEFFELSSDGKLHPFSGKLRWSLAVVEMKFIPKLLV